MPSLPWGHVKRALSSNDYSSVSAGHSQSRPSYSSDSQQSGEDDGPLLEKEIASIRRKASLWYRYWRMIVAHLLLLIVYLGVLSALVTRSNSRCQQGPRLVTTPAFEALEWEEYKFKENSQSHGPFSGFPRPEIDENWDKLLEAENIMLEPEVMRHYGREDLGVAIPEGGGYIGTLNVYHELHCIKRIYQYTYPDHYWKDLDDKQREINRLHNEHCLDFLRQAAMCHADLGLITFQWSPDSLVPVANATTHQCANWEKIDAWTRARTVDMMKPGWLVHPTKGPAFPIGEGLKLGAMKKPHDNSVHLAGGHEGRGH